jgi:hypothetical protein
MTFLIGTPHTHNAGFFENRYSCDSVAERDDVQTCKHCQTVIKMREWVKVGGWCSKCSSPLCQNPECVQETALMGCVPFLQKLERQVNAAVKFDQHLKMAGLEPQPIPQSIILSSG